MHPHVLAQHRPPDPCPPETGRCWHPPQRVGRTGTFLKAPQKTLSYVIVLFASERMESRGLGFHHKPWVIKCFNHTAPLAMWEVGGWFSFSLIPKAVKRWQHLSLRNGVISSSDESKVELKERYRKYVVSQTGQDLDLLLSPMPLENWVTLLLKWNIYII